jgi:hypothetical protein
VIRIEIDQISPSTQGLRCGGSLHYSKDGPVRFVHFLVPWSLFSRPVRQDLLMYFDREREVVDETDPLF